MPSKEKLICVVGATGNQGGSVALRFLQDPRFHVRGLTRDPSSRAAQKLASRGAELVAADLDDVKSLEAAFQGANVIFSVTQYWEPFFRPDCRAKAVELGISCRKYAYDVEHRQGKNIADAAATVLDTLDDNGFLVSTLSHAGKCSDGRYNDLYHFDGKADIFPDYVVNAHPQLAKKMSCIQTGCFTTSHKLLPDSYLLKKADGSFRMRLTTDPDKPVPHLDVNADMGNFTYAVYRMPSGKHYMAAGENCSWSEFIRLWSKHTGLPASYEQVMPEEMIAATPDYDFGVEATRMFSYMSNPGYDGAMDLLWAEDLRKAGIECPMTSLKEAFANQDWSDVLVEVSK